MKWLTENVTGFTVSSISITPGLTLEIIVIIVNTMIDRLQINSRLCASENKS